MKFIRRFFRHIREGFIGVGRHFGMCLSASVAVTITLVLISIFLMIVYNLNMFVNNIEEDIKISVLVDYDQEDQANLDRIEKRIYQVDGVVDVEHRTKEEEYEYYVSTYYEDDRELFAAYEDSNPFHEVFIVTIADGNGLEEVSHKIDNIAGVFETNYGGVSSKMLIEVLDKVTYAGFILVASLCALAIYLVYNTIQITIASRKDEIWIMRNVGAKNGYIRAPFLVEGIIIGIIGSIVPCLLTGFGYYYLYEYTGGYLVTEMLTLVTPYPYAMYLCFILVGVGVIVGFIGSYLSVCKHLRRTR